MSVDSLLEKFVWFFTFEKEVFGASENARVTFAKMKDKKDEDHNDAWLKDASFTATNLKKKTQSVFKFKDTPKIKVIIDSRKVKSMIESTAS